MQTTQNVGGMNITQIETDFFKMGVVWDRFMPSDAILIADVKYIAPVFQVVPGKGVFFQEPLAKVGASDREQLYGQIGLAHGPAFLHGAITGLKSEGTKKVYALGGLPTGEVLGKGMDALVTGMKINADCEVTGEFKKITNWTEFDKKNGNGHFFPLKLNQTGEKLTIKTNGDIAEKTAAYPDDQTVIAKLTKKGASEIEVLVDGISQGKFTFRGAKFSGEE